MCGGSSSGMREAREEAQLRRQEVTDDEDEDASGKRARLLFVGDLIPGFSRHGRHFLRVRVGLAFLVFLVLLVVPFSLEEVNHKSPT